MTLLKNLRFFSFFKLSFLNKRRWENFKANRRGYISFKLFLFFLVLSLFSEFLANDKPIFALYKNELLFPIFITYPEEKFGGLLAFTDYKDPAIQKEIEQNGWILWPPIRYSWNTNNYAIPETAPTKPSWMYSQDDRCRMYPLASQDTNCTIGNWNWLGTDDQARDVLARTLYAFRLSVLFGLCLTLGAGFIGVSIGALQGYFGGITDLVFQRFIEIWSTIPALYLLMIITAILPSGFFILLGIMLLFSWISFSGIVRAEFLRTRNFEYILAARALGISNTAIIFHHLLPNAMVATLTFLPFILNGSITTLTSLDYLGFGLPLGSPSLGEILRQGQRNLHAPWLVFTGFTIMSCMLSLLVFIGEATRDAFDPRKIFQ